MAFRGIHTVEKADTYISTSLKKARTYTSKKKVMGDRLNKIKTLEITTTFTFKEELIAKLRKVYYSFPQSKGLSEFYKKLLEYTTGMSRLEKELNKILITITSINKVFQSANFGLKRSKEIKELQKITKSFIGRVSSLLKNINFSYLETTRKNLQSFPTIKQKFKQIAIAGFPNVGKSTLLSKISGSKPEIAAYAFTTKGIMIGYSGETQFMDTPGTLNRFNKMNDIEQQAYLVLQLVAEKIIYIFDLTESYPIEDQIRLYERIKLFNKPIIIYLSKTDIIDKEKVKEFSKKYKCIKTLKELKSKL